MKQFYNKDQIFPAGVSFETNGKAYPWNWFDLATDEDLKNHGFEVRELPDPKIEVTPDELYIAALKEVLGATRLDAINQELEDQKNEVYPS